MPRVYTHCQKRSGKPKMLRRFFRTLLARVKWKWSVEQENASSVPELEPLTVP